MTALLQRVGRLVMDPEAPSLGRRFRARRAQLLLDSFPQLGSMDVLDLGGRPSTWTGLPVHPRSVTLVNLEALDAPVEWMSSVQADVCDPPPLIRSQRWDLVFSNSVIEHLGGHRQRTAFARHASALGAHLWVQTPYRYFPIEPHWLFPGMQFLPDPARARIAERWPFAWSHPQGPAAVEEVLEVELLSATAMRHYFPTARIMFERAGGLPKSLIAAR